MFLNKSVRQWIFLSLFITVFFTSCDNEDDGSDPIKGEGNPYVLSLAIQGSEGGFTYYTVPFEDVMSGALSAVGQGIEQPGYYDFTQIDNTIYSIGGLDDIDVVGITKNEAGEIVQIGSVSFENSLADLIKADDNTLVALELSSSSDVVRFHTINANTVITTSTKEHPVSAITHLVGPSYSGMQVSGNNLFVSYYISNPDDFSTPYTDEAKVVIYSYPELEFQKVIEDTRTGPLGGFNTKTGLIKDEKGDIYALSHSNKANGYSQKTRDGGILRIKSGETEFDQDYFFEVEEINDGKNISYLKYLSNGKAFAEVNMAKSEDQVTWSDAPLRSAIVDLYNKTITYIDGVPEHTGNGRRLAALYDEDYVYLSIPEDNGIFVYRIDVANHTATKGAEIEANFLAGFFRL